MLDDYKQFYRSISDPVEANETRIIAFHGFLNEEVTEATLVQVHTDTAPMEFQRRFADNWDESSSKYSEMLEVLRVDYYGTPRERALATDRQLGVTFSVKPGPMHGFVRSPAGRF